MAVRFCILVEEGRVASASYSYQGCPALAAICAAITRLSQSMTIDEAESITAADVWEVLGGLPEGHDKDVGFALGTFKETVNIYRDQKRLTKAQHDAYFHFCGLTGQQLDESDTIPCGECPWLQNCENDHVII
jgi:NifU-like protein involved in Fe-S cluster formation